MAEFKNLTQVANYIRDKQTKKELREGYVYHLSYDHRKKMFILEATEWGDE